MMAPSSSSSSSSVKRACDACHRRKVKCIGDGTRPCKNCSSSGLTCTYNSVPQKKGPKGSRAKVISELRETQRQTQLSAQRHGSDVDPGSPAFRKTVGLLSPEIVTPCVDFFFTNLYGTMPILHRQSVLETINQIDNSLDAYCLVTSLCGYMLIQANLELPPSVFESLDVQSQSNIHLGRMLVRETINARKAYDYVESPSLWSVTASFFLFGSYFCLDEHGTAWFHLREATTLALTNGMHEEATYKKMDNVTSSRRRRLFWLLFVTERAYALQQHRPLSLHATINLPTVEDSMTEDAELGGFLHLVNLFRPFDDTFVSLWNKARSGCSTEWLSRLQQQLSDALPVYLQSTECQAVDLRVSQQWLRTMIWQLSISHGYLSSAATDNAMSFQFPIEVSRDLVASATGFSQEAMETHGVGLIEKLFDICCTLVDVISYVPYEQQSFEYGPREYLHQLMTLISNLRGGQQRYMPLLMSKINDTMPHAPSYAHHSMTGSSMHETDMYGGSEQARSEAPSSSVSSPFGTPPLSALEQHHHAQPFGGAFVDGFDQVMVCTSSSFASAMATAGIGYGELPVSGPMQMFTDPSSSVFPGTTPVDTGYDSDD